MMEAQAEQLPRPAETRKGDMLYRSFGKTGESVSVIGVGGSHIGQVSSEDLAIRIIRTAIDHGVNLHGQLMGLQQRDGRG